MTLFNLYLDASRGPALDRVNVALGLDLPRYKLWRLREPDWCYRERVRAGVEASRAGNVDL